MAILRATGSGILPDFRDRVIEAESEEGAGCRGATVAYDAIVVGPNVGTECGNRIRDRNCAVVGVLLGNEMNQTGCK